MIRRSGEAFASSASPLHGRIARAVSGRRDSPTGGLAAAIAVAVGILAAEPLVVAHLAHMAPTASVSAAVCLRVVALLALGAAVAQGVEARRSLVATTPLHRRSRAASIAAMAPACAALAMLADAARVVDAAALAVAAREAVARPRVLAPAGDGMTLLVFAPLVEELAFRRAPLGLLVDVDGALPPRRLLALAAWQLVFAAVHLPRLAPGAAPTVAALASVAPTLVDLTLAGCCLAALTVATRALAPAVLVHASANLLVLLLGPALPLPAWRAWIGGLSLLVAIAWPRATPR